MKLMKPMIAMMTLGSILVYAGIHEDKVAFSYKFEHRPAAQAPKTFNDLNKQRELASVDRSTPLPAIQYVALNQANRDLINSEWEIMRIVGEDGNEVFNAYLNEDDRAIRVDFELLRTSVIQIDKEEEQIYYVSLLTEGNTIALFKEFNGGYEILEARKVARAVANIDSGRAEVQDGSNSGSVQNIPATDPSLNAELILEKALNPVKAADVLIGDAISGSATVRGGSIERLSVTLHRGTPNETSLEIQFAEINDGGQFETQVGDEMVSGILTNNGNEGFRIRFATGPLQGAMLNFVTEETYEEMMIQRENQEYERLEAEESPIAQEIREQQEEFQNQRAQQQPAGTQAAIYQPADAAAAPRDEYQEEYREEEYKEEEYKDEYAEEYRDEYKEDSAEEVRDEYADEYKEEEQGQIQSEIADNGFEF